MLDNVCCCFTFPVVHDDEAQKEVVDASAIHLSHAGKAAYEVLRTKHQRHHHSLWNVTSGTLVGEVQQTPKENNCSADCHDEWFPQRLCDIMKKTHVFCDVMSLGPPDGLFLEKFREALSFLSDRSITQNEPIVVRMMFGNIIGMPVNCDKIIKKLTKHLPAETNLELWVGAWRKGVSWNHAKIIAVDGHYLWTGGHNLWDEHYLRRDPVHDLSIELEGRAANNAHLFANEQWVFVEKIQSTCCGSIVDKIPDGLPLIAKTRVTVSEFPRGKTTIFPPAYDKALVSDHHTQTTDSTTKRVPILCIGRQGTLYWRARPADDAINAMLSSAQEIVQLCLQDLGPVCIPSTKITLPGCVWPHTVLSILGRILWERGVDIELILSNPGSIPGNLPATEACYGNGWSCVDVAAELIKTVLQQFPDCDDAAVRQKVRDNLRVCFLRNRATGKNRWADGKTLGLHSKHFIVDRQTAYVGSQNLYVCDLAEWGVVIDDKEAVEKMTREYWTPLWEASYADQRDCNVDEVMDGLKIDREATSTGNHLMTMADRRKQQEEMARLQNHGGISADVTDADEEMDEKQKEQIMANVVDEKKE